jgi:hypothetical protein
MPTGNVSIRLSLQDAETVRAGLEKLGSDGQAALKKIENAASHPAAGLTAIDKTMAGLKSRVEETAQSIGPLGTFLTGLGPIGLAAAAAIGATVAVIYEMSKAAKELGDRASQLLTFADTTGFTTTQIQALTAEGAKFALGSDQIGIGLQRLAVNLDAARQGTGNLYTDLHRISPELAHQVAGAKDVATAYDLIGKAIAQAHDKITAGGISQAAFGRGGAPQGQLAADVYASGGIGSLASGFQNAGRALDDGLIKRLSTLRSEIENTEQVTKDLMASMFAEDTEKRILSADQALERMAIHMKEMKDATQGEGWGQYFVRLFGGGGIEGGDAALRQSGEQQTIDEYRKRSMTLSPERLRQLLGTKGATPASDYISSEFSALATPAPSKIGKFEGGAEEQLKDLEKRMKALGDAATAPQKLGFAMERLNLEFQKGDLTLDEYAQKMGALEQTQQKAAIAAREQLGIASQAEILSQKMMQLKKDEADGYIRTEAEKQQAIARTQAAAEEAYKKEQVQNSKFPGLTAMGQTGQKEWESGIDKLGTGMINNLGNTIVENIMNVNKGREAWRQFGLEGIKAIEGLIVQMLILKPLAAGIGGGLDRLFGGGASGVLGSSNAAATGANAGDLRFAFASGGIMTSFGPLALRRYAGGGVASSPQMAIYGEGSGPEAYVPLPDGRSIPVRMSGNGGGGGTTIHTENHFHLTMPPGTSAADAGQMSRNFARGLQDMVKQTIDDRIIIHLRTGGLLNPA